MITHTIHRLDASDTSEEDSLEKQSGFGSKERPSYKRHATFVFVQLLLVCVTLAVCISLLNWTTGKYFNSPGVRCSIVTVKIKGYKMLTRGPYSTSPSCHGTRRTMI